MNTTVPLVDIVIVNWNAGQQLSECLASIRKFGLSDTSTVTVVDNASTDDSINCAERFNLPLEIIRNSQNMGFARACNQGATLGTAPFLLFLNPDLRLFEGSVSKSLAFMQEKRNSSIGICGVQLLNEKGEVSRTCARFPSLARLLLQIAGINKLPGIQSSGMTMKGWNHLESRNVDQVIGAFFMVRRELFETLEGFDERFFVYFEEVDFSYRARVTGWKAAFLAEAQSFHAGGGTSRQVKAARLFYSLRSRLLYGFKHFPAWQAWLLLVLTLMLEPVSRLMFSMVQGPLSNVRHTLMGYSMLIQDLPTVLNLARREGSWSPPKKEKNL